MGRGVLARCDGPLVRGGASAFFGLERNAQAQCRRAGLPPAFFVLWSSACLGAVALSSDG